MFAFNKAVTDERAFPSISSRLLSSFFRCHGLSPFYECQPQILRNCQNAVFTFAVTVSLLSYSADFVQKYHGSIKVSGRIARVHEPESSKSKSARAGRSFP